MSGKSKNVEAASRVYFPLPELSRKIERDSARRVKEKPKETLRFEENKMNFFPRDQSLSDLLYSTKRKTCNGNSNSGRRSTFAGNSALLPSDVIDFLHCCPLRGNSFIVRCHVTSK